MDVWIMDTCSKINGGLDVWTWRYWSSVWVTRLERPKGMKYKVKRPELQRASNKMSAPAEPLDFNIILLQLYLLYNPVICLCHTHCISSCISTNTLQVKHKTDQLWNIALGAGQHEILVLSIHPGKQTPSSQRGQKIIYPHTTTTTTTTTTTSAHNN